MTDVNSDRPYKFLDFYTEHDRNLFFGREREIDTLLSDIITSRLVLLFARTGTGKSSLINAGVRPRLHDDDYKTVVCRSGSDPADRARAALEREGMFSGLWTASFAADTVRAVDQLQRPLVVFFDQFEEFFLTGVDPAIQSAFIREVGKLYRDAHSGVHLVFSLREDYLAEMDLFRDDIPTIFEKESQLRLRPFARHQALEAIVGPSREFEPRFWYGSDLPYRLVDDLLTDGFVHPAELQIVCDTLWQEAKSGEISRRLYESLGGADGILERRVVQDLEKLTADNILLLERALPRLRTDDGTKRPRSVLQLASELHVKPRKLEELVAMLGTQRLIRSESWDDETYIEWVSDHVANLSHKLEPALQHISLRKAKMTGSALPEARVQALLANEKLGERLDEFDWRFLLGQAAVTRDLLGLWYASARKASQPVWTIAGKSLESSGAALDEAKAQRLILYLGEFREDEPIQILAAQLRNPDRARIALRALGALGDERAVQLIREAAKQPELQAAAADALRAIGTEETLAAAETVQKRGRRLVDFWPFGGAATLTSREWELWEALIGTVRDGEAAVLLGPGVTRASTLSAALAERFDYPFSETEDLLGIVQYLNIAFGQGWTRVVDEYRAKKPTELMAGIATWPVRIFVTSDPTVEIVRALELARKKAVIARIREEKAEALVEAPVVIPLFGHIFQPETLIDQSFRTVAFLGEWPVERPRVLISLGYEINDGEPETVRLAWSQGEAFILVKVVHSPALASVRHEGRALEYFDQYARSTGIYHYFGETEDFVNELTKRVTTVS